MKSVRDLTRNKRTVNGDFGVELEYEGDNLPTSLDNWSVERDGSLRNNSIEYVLRGPQDLEGLKASIVELKRAFVKNKTVINNSFRAGTHVHINCTDLNLKQAFNFICAYMVVEELMIDWCEPSRKGNHFCLSASESEFLIEALTEVVKDGIVERLNTDDLRYSSINVKSLFMHGSMEFRSLESTTNFEKLLVWCQTLKNIKDESINYPSPDTIVGDISGTGYFEWAVRVLGPHYKQFLTGDWENKMRRGMRNCQPIAFSRNWSSINLNIFRKNGGCFD